MALLFPANTYVRGKSLDQDPEEGFLRRIIWIKGFYFIAYMYLFTWESSLSWSRYNEATLEIIL